MSSNNLNDLEKISDDKIIWSIWRTMFLSTLISSIVFHSIGCFILFLRLRSHHYTKWLAILVQLAGFATPLFVGTISNALIAAILVYSGWYEKLAHYFFILIGLSQTICIVCLQFLKIMQTL